MKSNNLNTRAEKIAALKKIQEGKATISDLLPPRVEIWNQLTSKPGVWTNEVTGDNITDEEMEVREGKKGDNIIFKTILER